MDTRPTSPSPVTEYDQQVSWQVFICDAQAKNESSCADLVLRQNQLQFIGQRIGFGILPL